MLLLLLFKLVNQNDIFFLKMNFSFYYYIYYDMMMVMVNSYSMSRPSGHGCD